MEKKQKKNVVKVRAIAGILYPDSAPKNWKDLISELHIMALVSPLHDSDIQADGTPKKPHYHVLLIFDGPVTVSRAAGLLQGIGCIDFTQSVHSITSYARYLCHIDDHDKHRYDIKDVLSFGGADYDILCQRSLDKDSAITEMEDFIDQNHVYSFREFAKYCRTNQPTWHRHLTTDCGWFIKEYIKSAYWEEFTPEGRTVVALAENKKFEKS